MFKDTSFNQPLYYWTTNKVTTMSGMFENNPKFNQEIGTWIEGNDLYWDVSLVKDMIVCLKKLQALINILVNGKLIRLQV